MRRASYPSRCRDCGANTWHGLDADRAAIPVHVDRDPISRDVELLAIVAGRALYERSADGVLYRRPPRRALTWQPRSLTVHPVHVCGAVLPAATVTVRAALPDTPPF